MRDDQPNATGLQYEYQGVPLTPAIAQVLIRKLFSGKLVERQIIVEEVLRTHLAGGGLQASAQNLTGTIKKALADMKDSGLASNAAVGYWRIHANEPAPTDPIAMSADAAPLPPPSPPVVSSSEPTADIDIGSGSGAIYLYYLPTYRLRAQEQQEKAWPCKIGRTDRDPLQRVLAQAATALPERPKIAIILRTSQPSAWEAALHGVLTLRGLQIESIPGVEWFLTSPEEVLELIKVFDPILAQQLPPSDELTGT